MQNLSNANLTGDTQVCTHLSFKISYLPIKKFKRKNYASMYQGSFGVVLLEGCHHNILQGQASRPFST
jgi:hypothetical protein